jgi:hypothetical protein
VTTEHIHYEVSIEQHLLGTTAVSPPIPTLPEAHSWVKAHGVFDTKDAMSGPIYSDGMAVIGRWTIRRVLHGI